MRDPLKRIQVECERLSRDGRPVQIDLRPIIVTQELIDAFAKPTESNWELLRQFGASKVSAQDMRQVRSLMHTNTSEVVRAALKLVAENLVEFVGKTRWLVRVDVADRHPLTITAGASTFEKACEEIADALEQT